jgi:hypothetical protein
MDPTTTSNTDATVEALNELLRGELSAVESYDRALPAVDDEPETRADLADCRASHEARATRIRETIIQVGGEPSEESGAWGVFAKAVAGGAKVLGRRAVISALEEGEDHGLREYKEVLPKLDLSVQRLVSRDLYPQQVRTHSIVSALKHVAAHAQA